MNVNGGGNVYGVIGQPLTQDYLARQLPLFQEKVPKGNQGRMKFTTNAPLNLPIPPLYPGEEVQLQEHRVVCTDTFSEPAVGALYLTNFRIIFCGNVISDPESLDALQSASYSSKSKDIATLGGEYATSFSSKLKDRFQRNKNEANFHSFLYPDQVDGERIDKDRTRRSQRLTTGLKKKIGSLRRGHKSTTLPPPSHPPPVLDTALFYNPPMSLPTDLPDNSIKRRGVNYDEETASLDSTSASSLSEFSSTTGTDERSVQSPLREIPGGGTTIPIDIDGGGLHIQVNGRFSPSVNPDSGFKGDSSLEATLCSSNYQNFLDSGINFTDDQESVSEVTGDTPSICVDNNPSTVNVAKSKLKKIFKKAKSVYIPTQSRRGALQKSATLDVPQENSSLLGVSPRRGSRKFWENSLVLIESDSDSEESNVTSPPPPKSTQPIDSTDHKDYAQIEVLGRREISTSADRTESPHVPSTDLSSTYSSPQDNRGDTATQPGHTYPTTSTPEYAEIDRGLSSLPTMDDSVTAAPYSNIEIMNQALQRKSPIVKDHKDLARARSKSSSPRTPKKPKPLPRLMVEREGKAGLVASLPADFKPRPPPKPSKLASKNEKDDMERPVLSPALEEDTPSTGPSTDTTYSSPEHMGGNSLSDPWRADEREVSPVPIPPPRRKRTKRRGNAVSSSAAKQSPILGKRSKSTINGSHDPSPPRVNGSHDLKNRSPASAPILSNGGARESSDTKPDLESSVDLEDVGLVLRDPEKSPLSTHTSLSVAPSSRPHSIVSPNVFQNDAVFSMELDTGSTAYSTMPRNMAITWSPRSERASKKKANAVTVPASTRYTLSVAFSLYSIHSVTKLQPVTLKEQGLKLPDGLLILSRTSHSLKLHIHPHNTYDADALRDVLERGFTTAKPLHELFAFQYSAAIRHPNPTFIGNRNLSSFFKLSGEMERLGLIGSKVWRVTRTLTDHPDVCSTYPPHLLMPICTPDMDIIRGASLYKEGRFPTLTWLLPSGAALLRGAATKEERGQGSANQQTDEALLQAISACTSSSKGPGTLFVFTEKGVSDAKHSSLKPDEVRTYYYHNCKFVYSEAPPTYKSVRHSFNKLQALLESKLPDEDYLLALDSTKWLQRVGELLSVSNSVVEALTKHRSHVLVCFESGWDRTTQIVSLAQLLADPFYRTMNGFQVLIQKEWVWFGHPFHSRHSHQGKTKAKNDGPIFLQWLDCVWQVMDQCPSAFEFNEKFLMSLIEESYSGKFGTFMTDCEKSRKQTFTEKGYEHMSVSTHTVSYWTWVAMVNSVGRMFYNDLYDPSLYPSVIVPSHSLPRLKLWTSHYHRYKAQETIHQPNVLQRHLEDLLGIYKKLEAVRVTLEPHESSPNIKALVPPPLGPRDELERSQNEYTSTAVRAKPAPPPKPASSKKQFESIEQHLRSEGLDPSLCKHVELGQTTCQGNLMKIGAVRKNWLQRWFVLDFDCQYLAYFENKIAYENREVPKGVIRLSDITKVYQNMKKRDHLMRNIVTIETSQRTYLIQAPTIATMNVWQACLSIPPNSFGQVT